MPGIASAASAVATTAQRNNDHHLCNGTPSRNARHSSSNGFWSKHQQELTYNQLQKFWSELSPQSRQKILRIDKQTLFEQARKNMYCSRCHGLLLEGFLQVVMYGKSLQQEKTCNHNSSNSLEDGNLCTGDGCPDDIHDSSVHPWGGLTTQNGMLTLLDCYLYTTSLNGLQNVFDRARARERERELLYPDACGGDGRGWVSQEMGGYGRVHGTRESCALHTARLSVETLVDFWSALGEETRKSLLRMKEEDFIERLMYRFDSKRFCRDCRRNVIREFKELKELKRVRREIRCTTWFCVADAAFQYQVSYDTILVDWHEAIGDAFGTYHHFEWAVGTGEGKSDILEFENVGLNGRVQVKGLDLTAINSCYITLRGWKMDGRCTELSVKAHALKGQRCVHRRLMVVDGFVSITRGESIIGFFEQAEDAEEEEDDDLMDKDGNDIDGEYSRPQRHAKSPELAREFLLDAATVIFKEQIEKAFREGTARQNARSIFVCLSLKLLEERLHVACKEILTLEKQMKLLEEEEKEKREEEERKERKRTKEREKKLRRKERLREKEKDKGINCSESNQDNASSDVTVTEQVLSAKVDNDSSSAIDKADSVSEAEEAVAFQSLSSEIQEEQPFDEFIFSDTQADSDRLSEEHSYASNDCSDPHPAADHLKYPHQKLKCRQEVDACSRWSDRRGYAIVSKNRNMVCKYEPKKQVTNFDSSWSSNSLNKQPKSNRPYIRIGGPKSGDRYESHSCSCRQYKDNGAHVERQTSRVVREIKPNSKLTSVSNASNRPYYRHNQAEYVWDKCGRSKNSSSCNQDYPSFVKKVWEPLESSQKKHPPHINSDHGVSSKSCHSKGEATAESDMFSESCVLSSCQEAAIETSVQKPEEKKHLRDTISTTTTDHEETKLNMESKDQKGDPCTVVAREDRNGIPPMNGTSSNSENLSSSCLSEGDSTTFSSNAQSTEFTSSDSEDASQNSEGREPSACVFPIYQNGSLKKDSSAGGGYEHAKGHLTNNNGGCTKSCGNLPPSKSQANIENEAVHVHASIGPQPQTLPAMHSNHSIHFPFFQAPPPPPPPLGYYHQGSVVPWPAEASPANGFMAFPYPSQYVYANPNGYGLMNGNMHFMPYSPLQHLSPPPMLHVPVFQPVVHNNNNDVALKDYAVAPPNLDVLKAEAHPEANVSSWMPMPSSAGTRPPPEKAEEDRKTGKSDVEKDGFSLFHFGGPVPLSTGFMSDLVSLKKEIGGDTIPTKLGTAGKAEGDDDGACKKNTKIEEYNLFASSNGIKFSIF